MAKEEKSFMEAVLAWTKKQENYMGEEVLLAGQKMGAAACILAKSFPASHITAMELEEESIEQMRMAAKKLEIENLTFVKCDLSVLPKSFDTIISLCDIRNNLQTEDLEEPDLKMFNDQLENFYMPASQDYIERLHDHMKLGGSLLCLIEGEANPFSLAVMVNMLRDGFSIDPESMEKLFFEEEKEKGSLLAFAAQDGDALEEEELYSLWEELFDRDEEGNLLLEDPWSIQYALAYSVADLIYGFYLLEEEKPTAKYGIYATFDENIYLSFGFDENISLKSITEEEMQEELKALHARYEKLEKEGAVVKEIFFDPENGYDYIE